MVSLECWDLVRSLLEEDFFDRGSGVELDEDGLDGGSLGLGGGSGFLGLEGGSGFLKVGEEERGLEKEDAGRSEEGREEIGGAGAEDL